MKTKLHAISAAVMLTLAAAAPAYASLERVGPVNPAPSVGNYPAWYQDHSGITLEFCDLTTQAEWDNGWCVLAPPDGPEGGFPEVFPGNYFDEHFYYAADNVLLDAANGFRARLVIALEAAFGLGPASEGDQIVFARHRIDLRNLPADGDYRVITPFMDKVIFNQVAGDRIFETEDLGIACGVGTFSCALDSGKLGPFLLPSGVAGGAEVPPMPDLASAPPGTDPFFDALVAAGGATPAPGTGKQYLADPARLGTVTGSPLPPFVDGEGNTRNHNTFRVEVRAPSPTHDGILLYAIEGESNFTVAGRLMTGNLPGAVSGGRAVYRADTTGAATDVDVFTSASPTVQARIPAQPVQSVVRPALAFYPVPCAGAISVDPVTGATTINPGPYSAPAGTQTSMVNDEGTTDYWGQVAVTGAPPSHVCVVDTTARNAAGQLEPVYTLKTLTDDVVVKTAGYDGPNGGMLTVTAESSDPTAQLTLAGFGSTAGTDGVFVGRGTGSALTGGTAKVRGIKSPPSKVQVASSKGGAGLHTVQTARGMAAGVGQVTAGNDAATVFEDCSATSAASCAPGQGVTIDLLANDTALVNGSPQNLRAAVAAGATVTVSVATAARLGVATVSADGILTYVPNPNASGTDGITYTVSVNGGAASDPATVNITVTPVNDAPVAGNVTINAVQDISMTLNLLANSSDPDGALDVKNAIITSWPTAQLGPQPVPVNGVITFTPVASGSVGVGFKVVDAAGVQSENTATSVVTTIAGETITITRAQFETGKNRWRVDGTDTIRASQTISITYTNGVIAKGANIGKTCDGTAAFPECTIGTTGVTATGAWSFDASFGNNVFQNPATAGGWSVVPTQVRAWSSNPVLGGGATAGITRK